MTDTMVAKTATDLEIVAPFYLTDFIARVPGTTLPVTQFRNGADIELAWDSNGTAFTVYAAQDAQPVWTGTGTSCVITGGRTDTTTFVVAASVTGGPESGTPNPSFETIYLYDALTVTISDPTITPLSVTTGTLDVTGTATVTGATRLADTVVGGALTVTGPAALDGGATATGLTVSGPATVRGATSLAAATVNGALTVNGATSLASATVGNLTVLGATSMFAPRGIAAGQWYTASTDGILLGSVGWGSDAGKKCSAVISGYGQGVGWVYATGGNTVVYESSTSWTMWGCPNSYSVPVPRGTGFFAGVQQMDGNEISAPTSFWWIPFGKNATLTELSPDEALAMGVEELAAPQPIVASYDPDTAVAQVVETLVEIAGGDVGDAARNELRDAIRALATHGG